MAKILSSKQLQLDLLRETLASRRAELRRLNSTRPSTEQHLHAKAQMITEVESAIDNLEGQVSDLEQEILSE